MTMHHQTSSKPTGRVAFYGRVSQPKQKLEHQIELAENWAKENNIHIPPHLWFTDKGGRRHKSEKREAFQNLLSTAKAKKIDWVVVAMFDRWGVKDLDEFFSFRSRLKSDGVRLYSIQDDLELTSQDEGQCWQIFAKAMGAVSTMMGHADKNIMKMVERALNGWHLSGSHPFGTDLMCCRLADKQPIFRLHIVAKNPIKRGKYQYEIHHLNHDGETIRIENTEKMPPRDCKETGYRLVPSIDHKRIEAVRLIHQMYKDGKTNGVISKELSSLGYNYYGKGWGYSCIESILANPAYIGLPAWGKTATGYYRQTFDRKSVEPVERSGDQAAQYIKDEKHFVYPREAVFAQDTFMDVDLFNDVDKLVKKRREKPRNKKSRDISKHHLSGLLVCPDCKEPMDIHSSQSKGKRVRYFICSTYVRSRRVSCKANSVKWKYLDQAASIAFKNFKDKLEVVESFRHFDLSTNLFESLSQAYQNNCNSYIKLFFEMAREVGIDTIYCDINPMTAPIDEVIANKDAISEAFYPVYDAFFRKHEMEDAKRQSKIKELEQELDRLADCAVQAPSKRQRDRLWEKSVAVEKRIESLQNGHSKLMERMETLIEQAQTLRESISKESVFQDAQLWQSLVESITPIWRENPKPREPRVAGFVFKPQTELKDSGIGAMEILLDRRGRDSSRRSASRSQET